MVKSNRANKNTIIEYTKVEDTLETDDTTTVDTTTVDTEIIHENNSPSSTYRDMFGKDLYYIYVEPYDIFTNTYNPNKINEINNVAYYDQYYDYIKKSDETKYIDIADVSCHKCKENVEYKYDMWEIDDNGKLSKNIKIGDKVEKFSSI